MFVFPKGKQAISWWLMFIACSVLLASSSFKPVTADCGSDSHYIVGYYPSWKRSSLQNITWSKLTHVQLGMQPKMMIQERSSRHTGANNLSDLIHDFLCV